MKRNYFYRVDNLNQLDTIKFCPYCGTDNMYVYLGDFHNYTVCFECEDELEFMAVMSSEQRYYASTEGSLYLYKSKGGNYGLEQIPTDKLKDDSDFALTKKEIADFNGQNMDFIVKVEELEEDV